MRYRLAHYRECRAHREWNTTCPACGRRGKFVPYIDTVTMRPVDDRQCGRCNRESNCGYHLPPREMPRTEDFVSRENKSFVRNNFREICEICVNPNDQREQEKYYEKMRRACNESQPWGSHLRTWLLTQFPREAVDAALKRYRVGGTPDGATLWWQIDSQGRVRTGKAMQYNPLTGHRVKGEASPPALSRGEGAGSAISAKPLHRERGWGGSPSVNWAHRMRLYGEPTELVVPQCLFGEHLAPLLSPQGGKTPTAMSAPLPLGAGWEGALVESEKTALIMSLMKPDTVWLATGGKQNLKAAMLTPLIGLDVALYPDADALHQWYTRAVELNRTLGTRLYIPTWYYNLMDHDEARAQGLDLADVVLNPQAINP